MIKNEASKVPENWQECVLSDILYFQNGHAFKSHDFIKSNADKELVPLVKQSQLKGSQVILEDCVFLPSEYLDKYSDFIIRKGDILIGMSGSIGKMSFYNYDYPSLLNQRVGKLELYSKDVFNNNFFGYLLLNLEQNIQTIAKGMGVQNVSSKDIEKIIINLPPINEQNRIVDKIETLFSEVDAGIANLNLAKRQLEQYRQSLLKHAFEGKLTAKWREEYAEKHGKSLPNANELLEQIQTARQNYYDQQIVDWEQAVQDWEEQGKEGSKPRKLSAMDLKIVSNKNNGQNYSPLSQIVLSSNLGKMLDKNKNEGEPKEYLGNINVRWGDFELDNLKEMKITEADYDKCLLKDLDLVICEGGEPARCAVWLNSYNDEMYIQKALHRVRLPTDLISPYFLQLYFEYLAMTGLIDKYITGTTIKHLTGTNLAKIPIPILSIDEQKYLLLHLDSKFEYIDVLQDDVNTSIKQANLLKTSILHKAFQGKLVPQDPNDAPASELLAQIKAEREAKALAEKKAKQDKAMAKSKAKTKSTKASKKSKKDEQITLPL